MVSISGSSFRVNNHTIPSYYILSDQGPQFMGETSNNRPNHRSLLNKLRRFGVKEVDTLSPLRMERFQRSSGVYFPKHMTEYVSITSHLPSITIIIIMIFFFEPSWITVRNCDVKQSLKMLRISKDCLIRLTL